MSSRIIPRNAQHDHAVCIRIDGGSKSAPINTKTGVLGEDGAPHSEQRRGTIIGHKPIATPIGQNPIYRA
jgi:hypothetical protein